MESRGRVVRALVLAMCAGAALMAVDAAPAEAQNARWGANYFPNVTLTTQDNRKVRFYDDLIKGKIVAVNLIYTSCTYACPLETARLAQVQRLLGDRMGKDVFFYSITIDPAFDTPAVLKEYAARGTYRFPPAPSLRTLNCPDMSRWYSRSSRCLAAWARSCSKLAISALAAWICMWRLLTSATAAFSRS